jgi:hypothetical protein
VKLQAGARPRIDSRAAQPTRSIVVMLTYEDAQDNNAPISHWRRSAERSSSSVHRARLAPMEQYLIDFLASTIELRSIRRVISHEAARPRLLVFYPV